MKSIFFFFLVLVISKFDAYTQTNNFRITYMHSIQFDTAKSIYNNSGFEATLTGNNRISNYTMNKIYNYSVDTSSKTMAQLFDGKQSGTFTVKQQGSFPDSFGNQVFYNKLKDSIYLREKMPDEYIITKENAPKINWHISSDTLTILGHVCTLAEADFRGRHYLAFFTTEIPVVAGPWKFIGLPGLVLLIQDDRNQVKIFATKIEFPVSDPVQSFSGQGRLIFAKEYVTIRDKIFENNIRKTEQMVASQKYFDKTNLSSHIAKTQGIFGIELKAE